MAHSDLEYEYNPGWSDQFKDNGFVVLRNIIPAPTLAMLNDYYWFLMRNQQLARFPTSLGKYGDLLSESLLIRYQKLFEEITGHTLYPTFSFMRLYYHNSLLAKHRDRVGSEFAVSIAIDYDTEDIWPLHLKDLNKKEHALKLDRGDMVLYRGCDLVHWREAYPGRNSLHLFLFYVDSEGPMKHLKYDTRKKLGDPHPSSG
ncbi:MAG: hypothetical protein Roseis3KO_01600 [Roseivirga sp.]